MDTSREDVGITIRSAFLAKGTKQKFSLFALVVLSIVFIYIETIEAKPSHHVMEGVFGFAEYLGVDSKQENWHLYIPEPASAVAENIIDNDKIICVISPCSSQRFGQTYNRSWSVENYLSVIDHLIKTYNIQVILTGGASEIE